MADSIKSGNGGATTVPVQKRKLSPKVCDLLAERTGDLPVWVRSPKSGMERYSGLSRAKLYELASASKIKSASLREPGRIRGCRLFLLSSILAYIASNEIKPVSKDLVSTAKSSTPVHGTPSPLRVGDQQKARVKRSHEEYAD
jgi:hypothetical protein